MKRKTPTPTQFGNGVHAYRKHEDPTYRVATFLVERSWFEPPKLADGVAVLLLTWNQAFYRYGRPDFGRFEKFLARHARRFKSLRRRDISTFSAADTTAVRSLFTSSLKALEIAEGGSKGRRSPVAVSKALHLLAPSFFPLWDAAIARGYSCYYSRDPAAKYLRFMGFSKQIVTELRSTITPLLDGKTPLKVLDEYNYSKYTKKRRR